MGQYRSSNTCALMKTNIDKLFSIPFSVISFFHFSFSLKTCEYEQGSPQLQAADKPMEPLGCDTENRQLHDSKKTRKAKQPVFFSSVR